MFVALLHTLCFAQVTQPTYLPSRGNQQNSSSIHIDELLQTCGSGIRWNLSKSRTSANAQREIACAPEARPASTRHPCCDQLHQLRYQLILAGAFVRPSRRQLIDETQLTVTIGIQSEERARRYLNLLGRACHHGQDPVPEEQAEDEAGAGAARQLEPALNIKPSTMPLPRKKRKLLNTTSQAHIWCHKNGRACNHHRLHVRPFPKLLLNFDPLPEQILINAGKVHSRGTAGNFLMQLLDCNVKIQQQAAVSIPADHALKPEERRHASA